MGEFLRFLAVGAGRRTASAVRP